MAVRVFLEVGHEASLRTKRTPEGFTHDWEVYVRSPDGADIAHYVEKVVFQLHDTFPKPKRVVKEPPYSVKESGYAGFNLPIEIYLKNRDEPKKIRFNYDLHLQQSGPAIKRVRNEPYVFPNPSDDFRRKLLKGGGAPVSSSNSLHANPEHERNSRDSFTEEKPQQLIGKPKLGGDSAKKHKTKEYRDDNPRPSNSFENLFGVTIHKTSRVSPDPKKPSPTSKNDKKDKEKLYNEKEKQKSKIDMKERDHREDKKIKDDKNKDDKRKLHKDANKEKGTKRPAEKPASPSPPPKKSIIHHSPKRVSSPSNKSNSSASSKEEIKPVKQNIPEIKTKPQKPLEISSSKFEKKAKKEKKSHDKDRDSNKKEHKKDKDAKSNILENRDIKSKELPKETVTKETPSKDKEKPPVKPDKPINKFSIENMLKDPQDAVKFADNSKHKGKADRERKHKHKKKDKKRDESREKNRDSVSKEKKHKGEKKTSESKDISILDKSESIPKDLEKNILSRNFKEKDRHQLTISPVSHDTSSQSSTKSTNKASKVTKNPLQSMIQALGSSSDSESDNSIPSDDDDGDSHKNIKINKPVHSEPVRNEINKIPVNDNIKTDRPVERNDKNNQFSNSRTQKTKDKSNKQELKEEKKQRKRKTSSKDDDDSSNKTSKSTDDMEQTPKKRSDNTSSDGSQRVKPESSRSKTDTKVQDDGVSSSLSDNPIKCDSPIIEDSHMVEPHEISPDYMMQLQELQQRIMTLQSNEELERVVNLIAETGKYEVTKKTFDFDLCMLDRSTVQQLQELIGCESRA